MTTIAHLESIRQRTRIDGARANINAIRAPHDQSAQDRKASALRASQEAEKALAEAMGEVRTESLAGLIAGIEPDSTRAIAAGEGE